MGSAPAPSPPPAPQAGLGRDAGIDMVRAGCLLVVVVLHSLMVGVHRGHDGELVTSVALENSWGFTVASWFFQVMPLFFMAGGLASLTQWRRLEAAGVTASEYVLGRVRRLGLPTAIMVTVIGTGLLTARVCGASADLVASAGLHAVQPLWFLAVYAGCTALVPVMERLYRHHAVSTVAWLGAGVVLVDLLARATSPVVGALNLALVWPLMQQLGFLLADGVMRDWSRLRLLCAAGGSLGLLGMLVVLGYSPNMLVNLNPPTSALAVLGLAQFFLLVAVRPHLDAALASPPARKLAARLSGWSMGVYLWHLPVALLLVAVLGGLHAGLPQPGSVSWWFTRIPWLAAVLAITAATVTAAHRLERMMTTGTIRVHVSKQLFVWTWMKTRMNLMRTVSDGDHFLGNASRPRPASTLWAVLSVLVCIAGTATALVLGAASWVGVPIGVVLLWCSVVLSKVRH